MPIFTLTGASGGGKSTIIAALKNRGFNTQPEIGRALVREQIKQNGTALPWQDMTAFRTLLFNRSVEMFDKLQNERGVYFFDRSFTDAIASFRTTDEVVPPRYFTAAKIRQLANPILICARGQKFLSKMPSANMILNTCSRITMPTSPLIKILAMIWSKYHNCQWNNVSILSCLSRL